MMASKPWISYAARRGFPEAQRPDIILLDMSMPRARMAMKRLPRSSKTPT
jgi:hypothetical protein